MSRRSGSNLGAPFKIGSPRIGLVHTCIMVNENRVLFRLSLDVSGTDSRVTSISFSIEDSFKRSSPLGNFQLQQIMFPGNFALENDLQIVGLEQCLN